MPPDMNIKKCTGCKEEKPISEFAKEKRIKSGYRSRCKACILKYNREWVGSNEKHVKEQRKRYGEEHREYLGEYKKQYYKENKDRIRKYMRDNWGRIRENSRKNKLLVKYNLTDGEYSEMLVGQGGVCAICGEPETAKFKGVVRKLTVDHNHTTGKIRGLLCNRCNAGIGNLRDDITILRHAMAYLEKRDL